VLLLVYNGIPWHIAAELPIDEPFRFTAVERIAASIIFGQLDGGRWNFDTFEWIKDKR
jgi:hypothetical protein